MRKLSLLFVLGAVALLCACGLTKKDLGFTREGPDESNVVTKEPLILPPGYNVRPKVSAEEDEEENEE